MSPKDKMHSRNLLGHVLDNTRPGGPRSQLEFLAILGQGAYGVVYLARDVLGAPACPFVPAATSHPLNPHNQPLYAVKCLTKAGLSVRQRESQQRELSLHARVAGHPGVVRMHNVVETADALFVVLDYCPGGDLFGMIVEQRRYLAQDALVRSVFVQVVDALAFCHGRGVFHRDIKPENILCLDGVGARVVLADFGLATDDAASPEFGCGSAFYMSPECQGPRVTGWPAQAYLTAASDVWALGVLLVNLACARNPWRKANLEDETFRTFVSNPDLLRRILPVSDEVVAVLIRCFCPDPAQRITLAELRAEVLRIGTFTLSDAELERANRRAKTTAKEIKAARRAVRTESAPRHSPSATYENAQHATDNVGLTGLAPAAPAIDVPPTTNHQDERTDPCGYPAQRRRICLSGPSSDASVAPTRDPRRRPSRLSPLAAHKPKAHPQRRRASTDSDSSATSASQPPTPTYPPRAGARAPAPTIVIPAAGRAGVEGEDLARSVGGLVLRHAQDVGDEVKVGGGRWEVGATGSAGTSVASFEWSWPVFAQWAEAAGSA